MEQLIRSVTKKYTDNLPDDVNFYTPDDLREFDIPEFVIQRIEVEMYRNLNESVVPPHSEWADMTADNVQLAWGKFIDAIVEEVRMPASFAASVFETALADVVELILQPRTAIPSILFGPDRKLSRDQLEKRQKFVTVNSHLVEAVLKYMEKKNKKTLDIGVCKKVVQQVDDRITRKYNSLDWAHLFQPLFILSGPEIDSDHLRIFFEDRAMNRVARRFDLRSEPVDKADLIEVLSLPDLLDVQDEDGQSSLFDAAISNDKRDAKSGLKPDRPADKPAKNKPDDVQFGEPEEEEKSTKVSTEKAFSAPEPDVKAEDNEEEEDTILSSYLRNSMESEDEDEMSEPVYADRFTLDEDDELDYTAEEDPAADEDQPLHSRFMGDEKEDEDTVAENDDVSTITEIDNEPSEDESSVSERFSFEEEKHIEKSIREKSNQDETEDETSEVISDENSDIEDDDYLNAKALFGEITESELKPEPELQTKSEPEEDDSNDQPIWQSFLEGDESIDEYDIDDIEYSTFLNVVEQEDEEPVFEPGFEPADDRKPMGKSSTEQLIGWLESDEDRFKDAIFSGSDRAYEQALVKLDGFDDWKQASYYIEKEIFSRNHVDMYSENAVDLTDRLQAYFDKFKS